MTPIKNNIQKLRASQGLDQQALADQLGVTRTYLSKLENQRFSPSPALMQRVCHFFGKPLGDVFYIENDRKSAEGLVSEER